MSRTYEFYHGTSTLFIDSILKYGLGGVNPNFNHKNIKLLEYLYGQCENSLFNEERYDTLKRETTLAMIKQTDFVLRRENEDDVILNFRHDGIYVSLSEFKAVTYATLNRVGSEILQRCFDLYQLLIENNVSIEIPMELNFYRIDKINIKEIKPILIKSKNIGNDNLIQENGYDGEEFLEILDKQYSRLTTEDKFINFQYMNFSLKKPIIVREPEVYEIDFSGNVKDKKFEYWLVKYRQNNF